MHWLHFQLYKSQSNHNRLVLQKSLSFFKKSKLMTAFYGWGSTVSMLWSHQDDPAYSLPLSLQEYLVLILSTIEGSKSASTLKPSGGFEHETPWKSSTLTSRPLLQLRIQGVLGSNLNYMLSQALGSNLNSKVLSEHGSYKVSAVIYID